MVHEYLSIDWNEVYKQLAEIDDLIHFADFIREWLRKKDKTDSSH